MVIIIEGAVPYVVEGSTATAGTATRLTWVFAQVVPVVSPTVEGLMR